MIDWNNTEERREHNRNYRLINKEKIKEKKKEYREKNKEKIKAANKKYREKNKEKSRIYLKEYYQRNKERWTKYERKEYSREYYLNWAEKNCDKLKENRNRWINNNPQLSKDCKINYRAKNKHKTRAQDLARRKINIPKNMKCEDCNIKKAKERHHLDYSKPLYVKLLCVDCHKKRHRRK